MQCLIPSDLNYLKVSKSQLLRDEYREMRTLGALGWQPAERISPLVQMALNVSVKSSRKP